MDEWLQQKVGQGRFAVHGTEAIAMNAFAVHFVALKDALAFAQAHPNLELADCTRNISYTSPYKRAD
ncbi:hypothetical protein [Qipengyuania qiaonensis]|nr:hypothetical protein [Qipengyuania qiaonensis]